MAAHNELGKWGEEQAANYLRSKGFTIIECDWHSGHRDIDIIATNGQIVLFAEVKTRRNRLFTDPETAIDYSKLRNLRGAINHYVKYKNISLPLRLDIITVVGTPEGSQPDITHLEDIPI